MRAEAIGVVFSEAMGVGEHFWPRLVYTIRRRYNTTKDCPGPGLFLLPSSFPGPGFFI
jgi:hypothetical protein